MTKTHTNKSSNKTTVKTPSFIAYQIRDREGKEAFWTKIGAAFAHGDEQGFTLQLETIPLDGRITLRVPAEK